MGHNGSEFQRIRLVPTVRLYSHYYHLQILDHRRKTLLYLSRRLRFALTQLGAGM
jgi:hypothetical protein